MLVARLLTVRCILCVLSTRSKAVLNSKCTLISGTMRMKFNPFIRNTPFLPAESQDAKWFPVEDSSSLNFSINYFISKLNFDAISGKIVTGAA